MEKQFHSLGKSLNSNTIKKDTFKTSIPSKLATSHLDHHQVQTVRRNQQKCKSKYKVQCI